MYTIQNTLYNVQIQYPVYISQRLCTVTSFESYNRRFYICYNILLLINISIKEYDTDRIELNDKIILFKTNTIPLL